ncbi:MAG: DUF4157 domain-containing protein [Ginsengibacter sp.]
MKSTYCRRYRRKSSDSKGGRMFKKDSLQEQAFFAAPSNQSFFKPNTAIQRKCADCEAEDKHVKRRSAPQEEEKKMHKKEEDKELHRIADSKEKEDEKKIQKRGNKEEEEKKVHRKEANSSISDNSSTGTYISSLHSRGQALPAEVQHFFGKKMGSDFSGVKIHTGTEAEQSAKEVNAKAYTIGNNIVFNEGQYNFESGEGKKLLAHELAHVIQQSEAPLFIHRDPLVDAGVPIPAGVPEKSAIDQELEKIWYEKGKAAFFERLRHLTPGQYNDTDTFVFILDSLQGDEKWLASGILSWGPETQWSFDLKIELELKNLPQSKGFAGVLPIIQKANPDQKRFVLEHQLREMKNKFTKPEFAKILVELNIVTLIKGASDTQKQWILGDDDLMRLLKQELTAADFSSITSELFNLSFLPAGKIRDATIDLYFSAEAIDKNTALQIINGHMGVYYIEDLQQPAKVNDEVKAAGLDPTVYTVYFEPPANKNKMFVQRNADATTSMDSTKIFVSKAIAAATITLKLVHETSHAINKDNSTADDSIARYNGEFRAYWLGEYRSVVNLTDRANQIKTHILADYPKLKAKYNSDAIFKALVDTHVSPDGNVTNQ